MPENKIKIINQKVCCPFCEENGYIYKTRLHPNLDEIFVCDECDGLWIDEKLNENPQIPNLRVYIEKNNLTNEEVKKVTVEYNWYK